MKRKLEPQMSAMPRYFASVPAWLAAGDFWLAAGDFWFTDRHYRPAGTSPYDAGSASVLRMRSWW